MTTNKEPKGKIVIDAVLKAQGQGEVAVSVPQSVAENSILIGRELDIHPVKELCYKYAADTFVRICQKRGFNEADCDRLKQLIDLNSGYINGHLLRAHFGINWAACSRMVDDLVSEKQACVAENERELYLLPSNKRQGGWLEPSKT